eukprot:5998053-Prymnesium_polylepis.1
MCYKVLGGLGTPRDRCVPCPTASRGVLQFVLRRVPSRGVSRHVAASRGVSRCVVACCGIAV